MMLPTVGIFSAISVLLNSADVQTSSDIKTYDDALILTPYIKDNLVAEARKLSKVASFLPKAWPLVSHSGYVTVNDNSGSNLFFWLFPSLHDFQNAPLVLFLGGAPGTASSSRVFFENGPYVVGEKCECAPMNLHPRAYHWSEIMHVLYIDSPVGSGFSFTKNDSAVPLTANDVVDGLYSAIVQIFQIFPEYQTTEFYIVGESYSAKYAALLAYSIFQKTAPAKINLKGLAVGNAWLDPENMMGFSNVLFDIGLIDSETESDFADLENDIVNLIANETYSEAFDLLQTYLPFVTSNRTSLVENVTGFEYFGNYLRNEDSDRAKYASEVKKFLNQPEIRRKLHVGNHIFKAFNEEIFDKLKIDLMKPIGPKLGAVMDAYSVVVYNGQLDLTGAYRLTAKMLEKTKWGGSASYEKAKRKMWFVEGELAGYVKSFGNFSEILVLDAGLHLSEDRPLLAWDLIKKFTRRIPFA